MNLLIIFFCLEIISNRQYKFVTANGLSRTMEKIGLSSQLRHHDSIHAGQRREVINTSQVSSKQLRQKALFMSNSNGEVNEKQSAKRDNEVCY